MFCKIPFGKCLVFLPCNNEVHFHDECILFVLVEKQQVFLWLIQNEKRPKLSESILLFVMMFNTSLLTTEYLIETTAEMPGEERLSPDQNKSLSKNLGL